MALEGRIKTAKGEKAQQTFRPVPLVRSAQHGADLEDLVDLGVAREERAEGVELRHDASDRPDVNRGGIESAATTNISVAYQVWLYNLLYFVHVQFHNIYIIGRSQEIKNMLTGNK